MEMNNATTASTNTTTNLYVDYICQIKYTFLLLRFGVTGSHDKRAVQIKMH